mmetsp:Transcript_3306/g.7769  ORF Transcript_3306/g.7769 Transcript_3306/m.7769 type:complete len:88 (-) Transcript_3306:759-1022(-)
MRHADGDMIRLSCGPLCLIDFIVAVICQQWRIKFCRKRLCNIPDYCIAIVCATKKVVAGVRGPRNRVYTSIMMTKSCQCNGRSAYIN